MTPRVLTALGFALILALVLPGRAAADGLPATGIDAAPLVAPGGKVEYMTQRAGRDTKLVKTVAQGTRVLLARRLEGRLTVPAVAYDGSPSGLAADGETLVLINPRVRFPRARTTFAVIDPRTLRERRRIRLEGDFSFDALSPAGTTMFLIQYTHPRNQTKYAVRAYDMRSDRLLPGRIVDPREPDEDMSGLPMTRAADADGRWHYTLYQGNHYPFVHALDTERGVAACIDLHDLEGRALNGLKLDPSDGQLDVVAGSRVLASIDTAKNEVIPRPASAAGADGHRRVENGNGTPWPAIAGATAALILLAAIGTGLVAATRGRRSSTPDGTVPITDEWDMPITDEPEPSSDRRVPTA